MKCLYGTMYQEGKNLDFQIVLIGQVYIYISHKHTCMHMHNIPTTIKDKEIMNLKESMG